jgi:uncharacterized iron-regulated membrane protein
MMWVIRTVSIVCMVAAGWLYVRSQRDEPADPRKSAALRGLFVLFAGFTIVTFLPWDVPWYTRLMYVATAVGAGLSAYFYGVMTPPGSSD